MDSKNVDPPAAAATATQNVSSKPKDEENDRKSLKQLNSCPRQYSSRRLSLSHIDTNTHTSTSTNGNKKMSINETDKKRSLDLSNSDSTAEIVCSLNNELNDPQLSTTFSPPADLNDSGRVIDFEATLLSNNLMCVLNSSADVSSQQPLTDLMPPEMPTSTTTTATTTTATTRATLVPLGTDSYDGCKYLAIDNEHNHRRRLPHRQWLSKPPQPVANLIGKATDVSNANDGSYFQPQLSAIRTFGSDKPNVCSGSSSDVNNDDDKRNKKTYTTISTQTTTVQHQSLFTLPPVNNQNKWRGTEKPIASCHSSFEASTSSLTSHIAVSPQSRSLCLLATAVEQSPAVTHSLIEERKLDLLKRSQQDTRARSRSRSPIAQEIEKNSLCFPSVDQLVKMYTKILQDGSKQMDVSMDDKSALAKDLEKKLVLKGKEDQLKSCADKHRNSPLSDEGCTLGQSPYSSDCDDDQDNDIESVKQFKRKKEKVARSASKDSALGLDEEPMEPPPNLNQGRRLTLTVTDLPLRPALLPLAEPITLPDSPTPDSQNSQGAFLTQPATVPSRVLIEERVVEIPEERFSSFSTSRRESAQSCISDYQSSECGGVRYVRTPSVVVSDYSDDLMCGITLEEIEYFRAQRLRRRSSVETSNNEKDDALSDVSAASSCSNLYYCGSTISALDGAECYLNGIRMPIDRKISDCSTCDVSADEDGQSFVIPEQPEDLKDYISYCSDQLTAQQNHSNRKSKKVGVNNTDIDISDANSSLTKP